MGHPYFAAVHCGWHDSEMTDPKAQVDMARVALRRAIAGAMVRKEHAEGELKRLAPELEGRRADRAFAESAGDASLVADFQSVIADLERQVELHTQAQTLADSDIESLKSELVAMDRLEHEAERVSGLAAVQVAETSDTVEQTTLSRVRDAINELEVEANLNDELAQDQGVRRRIEKATSEAAAKARLAELKAAHVDRVARESDAPPPSTKRKKTL